MQHLCIVRPALFCALVFGCNIFLSCHSGAGSGSASADSAQAKPAQVQSMHNPAFRQTVKKEPVDQYKEKVENSLNNWYFSVTLYETARTDDYLIKMKFEELEGEDTLRLPDLGVPPRPVLKKGADKYSCIVGFMDNDNQFREYKLVYVKDQGNELKLKTLKHYSVTEGFKLEGR